jgi:UDP-glucose 6-dehydrogenase
MKILIIGIVIGLVFAACMFFCGMQAANIDNEKSRINQLEHEIISKKIDNMHSDVNNKLNDISTKLNFLVNYAKNVNQDFK